MMKNYFCLSLFVVLMSACSSDPKSHSAAAPTPVTAETRKELWDNESADLQVQGNRSASPPAARTEPSAAPVSSQAAGASGDDAYKELTTAAKAQNEEAIQASAEKILSRVPSDVRALNALAMVSYRRGKWDQSAYLLTKALQKDSSRAELHSNMGLVLLAQNEAPAALKSFRKALELNPNDVASSANLGALYVAARDFIKARVVLETAYKGGLRDLKVLNNYGIALTATSEYDVAKGVFQEALKTNSHHRELLLNYAVLLVDHMNQFKEGLDVINRLKFAGPPPESRSRLVSLENKAQSGLK